MPLTPRAEHACAGGRVGFYSRHSEALGLEARFALFLPPQALAGARVPALYALAGLTCNEETFLTKSGALRHAAEHGLALVASDTSPRGAGIPGEDAAWDFGLGAGFYVDATEAPWSSHYRMASHVAHELPEWVEASFPVAGDRRGIIGHSMGGHGALVLALREPERWRSVSALAPIANPASVPWGEKAFAHLLGQDRAAWAEHDASLLLRAGRTHPATILVDQGEADAFLSDQLHPEALEAAAAAAAQSLTLRRHPGYDHSYWFIKTVIADHIAHHAAALRR
ncbi:S-formylglutathione hydrolase [Lichenicoccus sp.]|uniref:S-formylglutathione hydrolase n=1 Tax=Lichenicoccus sp. TaxID=2781899 RepID=UPI003D119271